MALYASPVFYFIDFFFIALFTGYQKQFTQNVKYHSERDTYCGGPIRAQDKQKVKALKRTSPTGAYIWKTRGFIIAFPNTSEIGMRLALPGP